MVLHQLALCGNLASSSTSGTSSSTASVDAAAASLLSEESWPTRKRDETI